jgi:hypothetical protein
VLCAHHGNSLTLRPGASHANSEIEMCAHSDTHSYKRVVPLTPLWVRHHGMTRPQVADGEHGLQIWRVAAFILSKQSRIADKVWSSSFGIGRGTPRHKNQPVTKHYTGPRKQAVVHTVMNLRVPLKQRILD